LLIPKFSNVTESYVRTAGVTNLNFGMRLTKTHYGRRTTVRAYLKLR